MQPQAAQNTSSKKTFSSKPAEAESVDSLAKAFLEKHKGNPVKAAEALENVARKRSDIRDALTEKLLFSACLDAVNGQVRRERERIWTGAGKAPEPERTFGTPAAVGAAIFAVAESRLLDWPLPGGMALRKATHGDVVKGAHFYLAQAATMRTYGEWLKLIAAKVAAGVKVEKVLSEEVLQKMKVQAQKLAK